MFNGDPPEINNTNPQLNVDGTVQGYNEILQLSLNALDVQFKWNEAQRNSVLNLSKMDRDMSSIVKSMGVTTQYSQLLKQELGRAVTEVSLMGGKQEDINRIQKEYIESTNRTIVLSTENVEKLFAVSQVSGVAVKALETGFRNAGMETTHISEEMKTVYHTANSLGVNAQTVSTMVVSNLDKMNRYGFGNGVEGMAKMAAKAAAMRVDMGQTLAVADKLFSPESAIDVASTLQRLGATSSALLDPLKLMDLAQNNVPELQNQLSELSKTFTKFDKETGKFQIMPEARKQLKEVADALGIDRAEFEKMALESAKIEKKLGEIDFSGLKATDDQKMMIANLAEFNKGRGDYTVKFTDTNGRAVEKAVSELKQNDLNSLALQQQSLDPQKELVDVAKQQLGASNTLIAQNNALINTMNTQFAITKAGADYLEASVESQKKMYASAMSDYTLDKEKQPKDFGKDLYTGLSSIAKGTATMEEAAIITGKLAIGAIEDFTKILIDQSKIMSENKVGTSLAIAAVNTETISKFFGTDIPSVVDKATKFVQTAEAAVTIAIAAFKEQFKIGNTEETIPPVEKDVAINANGQMFSLDKGDLMMAVNQNALLQSIGGGGSIFASSNKPEETKTSPKEIKITLDVNAISNDLQIKNAILTAFNHDDTMRTLRDKIGVVASDYGLTS